MSDDYQFDTTTQSPRSPVKGFDDSNHTNGATSAYRPHASGEPILMVQPARREDLQPSYAQVLRPDTQDDSQHGWYGDMINSLGSCIGTLGAIPGCICCSNPYKSVMQGHVGLVTKFGRFARAVDPGLVKINPLSEKLFQVDVKIQIVEVPQQVCMTKDNVNLHLTSVIYYHITSPHKAAFGISNIKQALVERTQTTLRHVIGARVLQDVIERREEIAASIREIIEETATGWGVMVESMLIKDIIFGQELQDSLSMAAQAKRTGEAKVIAARAEVESAKLMRQAADILSSKFFVLSSVCVSMRANISLSSRCSRHADTLPGGHASDGQICQQQGHLPAGAESDCADADGHCRCRRRGTEQVSQWWREELF